MEEDRLECASVGSFDADPVKTLTEEARALSDTLYKNMVNDELAFSEELRTDDGVYVTEGLRLYDSEDNEYLIVEISRHTEVVPDDSAANKQEPDLFDIFFSDDIATEETEETTDKPTKEIQVWDILVSDGRAEPKTLHNVKGYRIHRWGFWTKLLYRDIKPVDLKHFDRAGLSDLVGFVLRFVLLFLVFYLITHLAVFCLHILLESSDEFVESVRQRVGS